MDINILTGIAAIIAAVASLIFTLQRWHHHFSRQARERSKFHMHRRALAEKFVRQLRQAEFYSELEEEFCRRLSTHVEAAPNTIKTQVRKSVSDKFGNGAKPGAKAGATQMYCHISSVSKITQGVATNIVVGTVP